MSGRECHTGVHLRRGGGVAGRRGGGAEGQWGGGAGLEGARWGGAWRAPGLGGPAGLPGIRAAGLPVTYIRRGSGKPNSV